MEIITPICFKVSTISRSSYVGLTVAVVLQVFLNLYESVPEYSFLANSSLAASHLQVMDT